jgi:hypothetical protein
MDREVDLGASKKMLTTTQSDALESFLRPSPFTGTKGEPLRDLIWDRQREGLFPATLYAILSTHLLGLHDWRPSSAAYSSCRLTFYLDRLLTPVTRPLVVRDRTVLVVTVGAH